MGLNEITRILIGSPRRKRRKKKVSKKTSVKLPKSLVKKEKHYLVVKVKKLTPEVLKKLKELARKKKMPIVLKKTKTQIGKSKVKFDVRLGAMPPGRRISKSGKVYFEYRKNRSDVKRKI